MAGKGGWEKAGLDTLARWARMGNNRSDETRTGSEELMSEVEQEEMEKDGIEGDGMPSEVSGAELREEAAEQAEGSGPQAVELAQIRGERDQLLDRLARLQAEFDNARKRVEKEKQDAREYTIGATIDPFLAVMDNFQLALKAQGSAEQLRGGVELILKQMEDALKNMQVVPVESVGTQFDPRIHEALGSIETVEFPDHQVLEEIRRGYKIRERLLRPAMVKIAENKAQVSE